MGCTSTASAALISRLGGLAVYDTDFNITWLANANANGAMTWANANTWAAGLNVGGYTGWRLPTALNTDLTGPCYGNNCTGSELGHLFYQAIGATAGNSILTGIVAELTKFTNIQSNAYWYGTEYTPPNIVWGFSNDTGFQGRGDKSDVNYAWAVRNGDVGGSSVPEPGILGLMGIGALAWTATRSRRQG